MLWCQGAQNIGLSNYKLKSAITCTIRSQCTPVPDGQTDEHHGNSATIRSNERIAREKHKYTCNDYRDVNKASSTKAKATKQGQGHQAKAKMSKVKANSARKGWRTTK